MIDHRWLPPHDALALGRRAPSRPDGRWREEDRKAPRRTPDQER
jgi:hypothetical protein